MVVVTIAICQPFYFSQWIMVKYVHAASMFLLWIIGLYLYVTITKYAVVALMHSAAYYI